MIMDKEPASSPRWGNMGQRIPEKPESLREMMEYQKVDVSRMDALWELQKRYKAEIGEDEPDREGKDRLAEAIRQ